mmetsp:Transcript_5102/g.17142  ORF Transcript_5102/g.17142 Transcript_5102/m.17142 type:complete len:235 (+) Transcript_5102:366-1070(+)
MQRRPKQRRVGTELAAAEVLHLCVQLLARVAAVHHGRQPRVRDSQVVEPVRGVCARRSEVVRGEAAPRGHAIAVAVALGAPAAEGVEHRRHVMAAHGIHAAGVQLVVSERGRVHAGVARAARERHHPCLAPEAALLHADVGLQDGLAEGVGGQRGAHAAQAVRRVRGVVAGVVLLAARPPARASPRGIVAARNGRVRQVPAVGALHLRAPRHDIAPSCDAPQGNHREAQTRGES